MKAADVRRRADLLLSPTAPSPIVGAIALTGLRLLAGLIWLYNVVWKVPSDFGERSHTGLYHYTHLAVEHPVFKPFSWLIEHVVLPNFDGYGWAVLVIESVLAVLLLTGAFVRLAALLGVLQSMAIALSVSESLGEWPWAYAMMIAIHAVLLFTWSTRYAAVDAIRAAGSGPAARLVAQRLLGGWGVVLGLIGLVAFCRAVGKGRTVNVGIRELEFSLGDYNLSGALLLIGIALAMLAAAIFGWRIFAGVAALVAASAAVSIYLQIGKGEVWIGGTLTTELVFLCAAVISLATGHRLDREVSPDGQRPKAFRRL